MSKILCIPDIHCRKFWRKPVEIYSDKVDKIVFLGDYLDSYSEEIMMAPESMEGSDFYDVISYISMLNKIISLKIKNPEKYVLLLGNHTCSYIWPNFESATRTDRENWKDYNNFFLQNLEYFNLVWTEDNCIFSHAGISEGWAENFLYHYMDYDENVSLEKNSLIFEAAKVLKDTPLKDFNKYYIDAISHISRYRGGDSYYGSCEWADIREHIEKVISYENNTFIGKGDPGIFQVFGHTQLKAPLICDKWACLDCRKAFIFNTETHECKDCI